MPKLKVWIERLAVVEVEADNVAQAAVSFDAIGPARVGTHTVQDAVLAVLSEDETEILWTSPALKNHFDAWTAHRDRLRAATRARKHRNAT